MRTFSFTLARSMSGDLENEMRKMAYPSASSEREIQTDTLQPLVTFSDAKGKDECERKTRTSLSLFLMGVVGRP